MKGFGLLIAALSASVTAAFVPQSTGPFSMPTRSALDAAANHEQNAGLRKVGEATLAASLFFGMLTLPAHAIDYRLPPIDRSDPDRCTLKSSTIGQSNAQRDKLFDLRECKLEGANAQGYDLSGVIM